MTASPSAPVPTPDPPQRGWTKGSPNVVIVVLDDVGFAQLGCFGSGLDTPNLDRLASQSLRFTNFHTTALCAPTRASLLTGRNHHRVGVGWHPDLPMRFPGYNGRIPSNAGTLAEVLSENGWATYAIGKWHLTPTDERTPAGPFTHWPTGKGFDKYYGFIGGDTNQWTPCLVQDTSYVDPPRTPEEGYHLNDDLADRAISNLREVRAYQPGRPYFLYYATGAGHAPHQAPREWIDRYRGRFDRGWDVEREEVFARQREMGIVPSDAVLSPRPSWVQPWESLSDDGRRFAARTMEVFAAFLAHTDAAIGRVIDEIESAGELDNTVIMVMSDNGASGQGGPHGSTNEMRFISQMPESLEKDLEHIDELGGWKTYGHYAWGWALAGNTPLQRWKKYTWEGGTRDPLILHPAGTAAAPTGGLRDHYCHVVDVHPTVLAMCGIEVPSICNGVSQMSLDGVDLSPVITDPHHEGVRETQYYELEGSRAIYHKGWKAVTNHVYQGQVSERELVEGSHSIATDRWSLFDTSKDFAELHDLADEKPEVLEQLIQLWWYESGRNGVLPIEDTTIGRVPFMDNRWGGFIQQARLTCGEKLYHSGVPSLHRTDFRVRARFGPGSSLGEGILAEFGDWNGGWVLYARSGSVTWALNHFGDEMFSVTAPATGDLESIELVFHVSDRGGRAVIEADGVELAETTLTVDVPGIWTPSGGFLRCGRGSGFPVDGSYVNPWPYDGNLIEVIIERGAASTTDHGLSFRSMRHTD